MLHKSVTSASTSVRAFVALFIAAALCVVAAGCSGGSGGGGGDDKTLNILTWETYDDPAWLDQFTEDTGIKVNAVNVGSPAKVKANPDQFDVALVTSGWFDNYASAGLLEPIDSSKVTNALNPGRRMS